MSARSRGWIASRPPRCRDDERASRRGFGPVWYPPRVSRAAPDDLVGTLIPDLELPSSDGGTFRLRSRIGVGPLVLFFYLHNATPG
jgi:hypothetical protein